ncbi:hypothetical protein BC940DRAFT_289695 [Gongronella butleri]|nr:hypothetical protein BC940DRAFT_289695 [Gongronella butleri]
MFKAKQRASVQDHRLSYFKHQGSRSIDYTLLPKKIIKAHQSYEAKQACELSFERGDFFHVVGRENDLHWYAVSNPISNARGLVPVSYFDVVDKANRTFTAVQPELPLDKDLAKEFMTARQQQQEKQQKVGCVYGVVLYDFEAVQGDELACFAQERVLILAQCNDEWYVAKPIGRLGGPGLIPISYVQLHDISSNQPLRSVAPAAIPMLADWKRQTESYVASAISLVDDRPDPTKKLAHHVSISPSLSSNASNYRSHPSSPPFTSPSTSTTLQPAPSSSSSSTAATVLPVPNRSSLRPSARPLTKECHVDSFIHEHDQYWFILFTTLSNGKYRILYRLYADFYEFHVRLLEQYPDEAGKGGKKRILPFMPAPIDHVDKDITRQRREDLDRYCKQLLALPRYLAESQMVQVHLFGAKEGDVDTERDPVGSHGATSRRSSSHSGVRRQPKRASHQSSEETRTTSTIVPLAAASGGGGGGKVKIKIMHKDDIFAVRMSADCSLDELKQHVRDRIGAFARMSYRDDNHHGRSLPLETPLDMEEAFILAIQHGKLTIQVD